MNTLKLVAEVVLEKAIIAAKWLLIKVKSVDWQALVESVNLSLHNAKEWLKEKLS
jgi:hypothetical protein